MNDDKELKIIKFPTMNQMDKESYDDVGIISLIKIYAETIKEIYLARFDPDEDDDEVERQSCELHREVISICHNEISLESIPLLRIYFEGLMQSGEEAIAPNEGDWLEVMSHDDPYINALRIIINIQSAVLETMFDKLKDLKDEKEDEQKVTKEETTKAIEEETKI